jgi:hypothetical protein
VSKEKREGEKKEDKLTPRKCFRPWQDPKPSVQITRQKYHAVSLAGPARKNPRFMSIFELFRPNLDLSDWLLRRGQLPYDVSSQKARRQA